MDDDFGSTRRDPRHHTKISCLRQLMVEKHELPVKSLKRNNVVDHFEQPVPVDNNPKHSTPERSMKGVAEGVTTSPETGSHWPANSPGNRQQIGSSKSSVVFKTPNQNLPSSSSLPIIPNVVEYHLKVQSKPAKTTDLLKNKVGDKMRTDSVMGIDKNQNKCLALKLSKLSIDNNVFEESTDLPQVFQVKYLGSHDARGLWGIKHTRKPVDNMVAAAKSLPTDTTLPLVKLVVSREGVAILPLGKSKTETPVTKVFPIETISYGVQDLVYTRVFSMIVVRDTTNFRKLSPFECHGFVCESKQHARQLTYALATAFQIYSQRIKALQTNVKDPSGVVKKKFAIDLRTPDEIATDLARDSEA